MPNHTAAADVFLETSLALWRSFPTFRPDTYVLKDSEQFEVLHTNQLAEDDMGMASPAIYARAITAVDRNFKRVAFYLKRRRTENAKPGFSVVAFGADHKSRPTPSLFVAGHRTQRNPDKVASVWNVVLRFPLINNLPADITPEIRLAV